MDEDIIKDVGKIEVEVEHLKEKNEEIEKNTENIGIETNWNKNDINELFRRISEIEDKFDLINSKIDFIEGIGKEEILETEEIEEVKEIEKIDEVKVEDDITIIDVESDIPIKSKIKMSIGGII